MTLTTGGLKGQIPRKASDADNDWEFVDFPSITPYFDNTKGYDTIPVGAGNSGIGTENWRAAYTLFVPEIKAGDKILLLGEAQVRNDLGYNVELARLVCFIDFNDINPSGSNNGQNDSYAALLNGVQYHKMLPLNYDEQGNEINTSPSFYHVNGSNITPGAHYEKVTKPVFHEFHEDHPDGVYFYLKLRCNSSAAQPGHACWLNDQGFLQVILYRGFDSLEPLPPPPPSEITWSDTYQVVNTLDAGNLVNMGLRVVIPSSRISNSGVKTRITVQAPTLGGHTTNVSSCYIAEKTSTYSPAATPKQVTFNGSPSFSLAHGQQDLVSDVIDFAIDETKDYVLFFGQAAITGYCARTDAPHTYAYWKSNAALDGLNMNPVGYTRDAACGEYIIKKIEVGNF